MVLMKNGLIFAVLVSFAEGAVQKTQKIKSCWLCRVLGQRKATRPNDPFQSCRNLERRMDFDLLGSGSTRLGYRLKVFLFQVEHKVLLLRFEMPNVLNCVFFPSITSTVLR